MADDTGTPAANGTQQGGEAAGAPPATGADHFAEMEAELVGEGGGDNAQPGAGAAAAADTEPGAEQPSGTGAEQGGEQPAGQAGGTSGEQGTVPMERFNQVLGQFKDLQTAHQQLQDRLAKLEGQGTGDAPGARTSGADGDADAPWKARLKPLPVPEGRMVDGKLVPWERTEDYLDARADVQAENREIERAGRAEAANAKKTEEEQRAAEDAATAERLRRYQTEQVPEFLKEESLTVDQFNAALNAAPKIAVLDEPTGAVLAGVIAHHASNPARFMYRLAQTPAEYLAAEAAKLMQVPARERTAAVVAWVASADARVQMGLGLDGKPRDGSAGQDPGGDGLTKPAGSDRSPGSTTAVKPAQGGAASAGADATATGDAHFAQMQAEANRRRGRR